MWDRLIIAVADGRRWPLDLTTVEARLRERLPEAAIDRLPGRPGAAYLSFDTEVNGVTCQGIYVESGHITFSTGTPADWADIIAWFLGLLPPGTPIVALAEGNPRLVSFQARVDAGEVIRLLDPIARPSR